MEAPASRPRWWGIYLRGLAMGAADLVPGVSGGTIAFITGIYARLVTAIRVGSSPVALHLLMKLRLGVFWKAIDGNFLILLGAGILTALLLGVEILHDLLTSHTLALLSFFFGLTLGAAFHIMRKHHLQQPRLLLVTALGLLVAGTIQSFDQIRLSAAPNLQGFFVAGMLALCAMILPGISGSLLLLLLGVYPFLIDAVHARDLQVIAVFGAGGVIGLVLFARLLNFLLTRWHDRTLAFLVGIMLGALPRLWPWRDNVPGIKPILQSAVSPTTLAEPQLATAAACLLTGMVLIEVTGQVTRRMRSDA